MSNNFPTEIYRIISSGDAFDILKNECEGHQFIHKIEITQLSRDLGKRETIFLQKNKSYSYNLKSGLYADVVNLVLQPQESNLAEEFTKSLQRAADQAMRSLSGLYLKKLRNTYLALGKIIDNFDLELALKYLDEKNNKPPYYLYGIASHKVTNELSDKSYEKLRLYNEKIHVLFDDTRYEEEAPILFSENTILEGYLDFKLDYISEDISPIKKKLLLNAHKIKVNDITFYISPPTDRCQQIIEIYWFFVGGFAAAFDVGRQEYNNAVVLEI